MRKVTRSFRTEKLRARLGLSASAELDFEALASSEATPEQRAELAQVARVLTRQAPRARVAWSLRYVEGHTLEEAAELSDCSLATVKRWIRAVDLALRAEEDPQ